MKFCRHDWIIHKIQKGHSIRHALIIGSKEIPWLTFALSYAIGFAILYVPNFYTTKLPILLIFLSSIITGGLVLVVICAIFGDIIRDNYDPWRSEDKSCLKCGKIKFDATRDEDKVEKRIEVKRLREIAWQKRQDTREEKRRVAGIMRNKNFKIAQDRYKKLLEEYQESTKEILSRH